MRKYVSGAFILALPIAFVTGCGDSTGVNVIDSLPGQGDHTPHTGIEQGVWPPQPLGMSNVEALPASAKDGALSGVVAAARGVVLNNPNVRAALGDDYLEFDGSLGDTKSETTANFLFFSYTSDETVEVTLNRNGAVTHETFAAAEYQPTENAVEVDRAILLGQQDLTASGFEVTGLTGTAMLAFPPQSAITDIEQQYYPQRIMYVTFGPGNGEIPVYSALVNLSNATVSDGGLIK